jgi:hypothetical protein
MKSTVFASFLCLSAVAMAQDVRFDYERSANFSTYKTYQWAGDAPNAAGNQLMDQSIKRAIDEQLAAKGLRRVERGGDLQVSYQAAVQQEKQYDGFGTGFRFNGTGRVTTSTIEVGQIVINLTDSARQQLVWSGAAEKTLDIKKDPDKNYRNLQKTMAKIFKNYPPQSGRS